MSFVKNPGKPVELGGVRRVLPPLSIGAIEQIGEKIELLQADGFTPERMTFVIDLVHASLRRNYPDMPREEVSGNIDIGNLQEVLGALLSASGLTKDDSEPEGDPMGESKATGLPAGST